MNEKLEKLGKEIERTEAKLRRAQHEEKIPCSGEIPTPDEWLQYAIEKLVDE